ncbi:MAG: peroxide stress protein YaaA [bacterium]|nr:peroxide stress protein YaaA [bacterium]
MLTLLSPAKKLLHNFSPYLKETSEPLLLKKAQMLASIMREKSVAEIAALMKISPDLSQLNYDRYQRFNFKATSNGDSYPSLFLFQGDVYQGLQADQWDRTDIHFAQSHLRILSGLYGLLKPLDNIQPYRLEMGVHLVNPAGKNLYDYWQTSVTETLNEQLAAQSNPVLINLASTEYFKVVSQKKLKYPVVTINFYEKKNSKLHMIGTYAKKARGVMAQYIMRKGIDDLLQITHFSELGYQFNPDTSSEHHFDFIRTH